MSFRCQRSRDISRFSAHSLNLAHCETLPLGRVCERDNEAVIQCFDTATVRRSRGLIDTAHSVRVSTPWFNDTFDRAERLSSAGVTDDRAKKLTPWEC